MKKLLYLVTLSLVATMVFAPAALAQPCEGVPIPLLSPEQIRDLPEECFQQPEAQPETPNTRVTPDGIQYSDLPDAVPTQQYTAPTATQYTPTATTAPTATTTTTDLPATGGPSLLIPASLLLLASGLIGLGVMRRK